MVIENFDPLKGQILQMLDKDGNLSKDFTPTLTDKDVLKLYQYMTLSRVMDKRAINLQRQGRMITYIPQSGQEAAAAASVYALKKSDWLVPAFRELAGWLVRGAHLEDLMMYLSGNEQGSKRSKDINMLPISVPIGTQILHAVGISWAAKLKKEDIVSLAFFGDGATSEGDFHDGLNFAGVYKTPTVFFCLNNQWAISVPRSIQTASKTLAQKAIAYGFHGVQIDGNDIFAVHLATKEAIEKARKGEGPTLIEAVTYRQGPHTTADDPRKYRKQEEEEEWLPKDPLLRVRKYLEKKKLWDAEKEKELVEACEKKVEDAKNKIDGIPYNADDIFNYHYAELNPELKRQYTEFKKYQSL